MADHAAPAVQPSKWPIGPPAPDPWLALIARGTYTVIITLVGVWVNNCLGGVSWSLFPGDVTYVDYPTPSGTVTVTKTDLIWNWHPILMTLGFAVFMGEALLSYRSPALRYPWPAPAGLARIWRKRLHYLFHSAALACIVLGMISAFQYRHKAVPPPPDLYTPHSWLGIATVSLLLLQLFVAIFSYIIPMDTNPWVPVAHRMALGPVHRFFGQATWVCGLATMASGFQDKVSILTMSDRALGTDMNRLKTEPQYLYPCIITVLLLVLGLSVLYHMVPEPAASAPAAAHDALLPVALVPSGKSEAKADELQLAVAEASGTKLIAETAETSGAKASAEAPETGGARVAAYVIPEAENKA